MDDDITWEQFKKTVDDYLKKRSIDPKKAKLDYIDWPGSWVTELPTVHYDKETKRISIS